MKFPTGTIVIIALVAVLAAVASAGGGEEQQRNLQISAYYYGYNEASRFWSKGPYKCLADDVQRFESDIRREPICEDQYPESAAFIHVCNDGINDYVEEREEKCFATSDECEDFGETVADGIIATHCVLLGLTSGRKWYVRL